MCCSFSLRTIFCWFKRSLKSTLEKTINTRQIKISMSTLYLIKNNEKQYTIVWSTNKSPLMSQFFIENQNHQCCQILETHYSYEAFNKYFNIIYSFSREKTKACEWVWNWKVKFLPPPEGAVAQFKQNISNPWLLLPSSAPGNLYLRVGHSRVTWKHNTEVAKIKLIVSNKPK